VCPARSLKPSLGVTPPGKVGWGEHQSPARALSNEATLLAILLGAAAPPIPGRALRLGAVPLCVLPPLLGSLCALTCLGRGGHPPACSATIPCLASCSPSLGHPVAVPKGIGAQGEEKPPPQHRQWGMLVLGVLLRGSVSLQGDAALTPVSICSGLSHTRGAPGLSAGGAQTPWGSQGLFWHPDHPPRWVAALWVAGMGP